MATKKKAAPKKTGKDDKTRKALRQIIEAMMEEMDFKPAPPVDGTLEEMKEWLQENIMATDADYIDEGLWQTMLAAGITPGSDGGGEGEDDEDEVDEDEVDEDEDEVDEDEEVSEPAPKKASKKVAGKKGEKTMATKKDKATPAKKTGKSVSKAAPAKEAKKAVPVKKVTSVKKTKKAETLINSQLLTQMVRILLQKNKSMSDAKIANSNCIRFYIGSVPVSEIKKITSKLRKA